MVTSAAMSVSRHEVPWITCLSGHRLLPSPTPIPAAHLRTDPSFPLGSLAEAVRPAARAAVPDHVKATVLKVVRASICPTDDS